MSAELLAPAGDFETALAAFDAGADAVYCGMLEFSARAFAKNFTSEDLTGIVRVARSRGKKVYVTFNTVVDEANVEDAVRALSELEAIGPDALIVQDLGIARICRERFPKLEIHASTQLVAHNLEGVVALRDLGFSRVVLARELSLEEIKSISKRCGVELECFIHGALCYSVSGLCLFSAMEKDRSGNRGKCAYCCRLPYDDGTGGKTLPFSMKDLRLGEDVRKLEDAGVASLKIEGRMKSPLYVASVVRWYRQILDGTPPAVSRADLETVFSRRTTELYFNGRAGSVAAKESPIDPDSLGHLGTPIGVVKKVTKDREGNSWLRFHTSRALEKHDGLQFESVDGGKPAGLGISMMRQAISRAPVFEVAAGTDVEVALPPEGIDGLRPGVKIYCSMSNAVKRAFPPPSYRPSDYPGIVAVDVRVEISADTIVAEVIGGDVTARPRVEVKGTFEAARDPSRTFGAIEKALSKLGETDYRLGRIEVVDPDGRFAPMSILNDLRRDLVERLDDARSREIREKLERALADDWSGTTGLSSLKVVKLRAGQRLPRGDWNEVVVVVGPEVEEEDLYEYGGFDRVRLAMPVYTAEPDYNRLRVAVKRFIRGGWTKWEAADIATLTTLRQCGVEDITADWTCYAFNAAALRTWSELGVRRFVASPENNAENLAFLAESGYDVEFLAQQSTPLFISLTRPASEAPDGLTVFRRDGLWITVKPVPRTFETPKAGSVRYDLSWSPE